MRLCGYLLRPLCRRRLFDLLDSVVCICALAAATFVSPPPSCPSSLYCMHCCICALQFFMSPPPSCLSALYCMHCCGCPPQLFMSPPLSSTSLLCCLCFVAFSLWALCRLHLVAVIHSLAPSASSSSCSAAMAFVQPLVDAMLQQSKAVVAQSGSLTKHVLLPQLRPRSETTCGNHGIDLFVVAASRFSRWS